MTIEMSKYILQIFDKYTFYQIFDVILIISSNEITIEKNKCFLQIFDKHMFYQTFEIIPNIFSIESTTEKRKLIHFLNI